MKGIIMLAFLLVAQSISAQKWEKKIVEADEMKAQTETTMYVCNSSKYSFVLYESNNAWVVSGVPFKPDPTHINYRNNFETYAKIGFYDMNDKLIEKWDNCRLELTNFYRTATSDTSKKKKGQYAVSNYLKTANGYIRIIIPTIQGDEFDVTVPCLKNDNE